MAIDYRVQDMADWSGVRADLMITDPPFGIGFDGKGGTYNRNQEPVVDGYVEWSEEDYCEHISTLLRTFKRNTKWDGQALILSGWNNSSDIHSLVREDSSIELQGKLYWEYNFAPYCENRPAHNVYEIFWVTKTDDWTYNENCRERHCRNGESNLSTISVQREYIKDAPKYPTRLPVELVNVLVEHFSEENDTVFDPMAGSGMIGIGASNLNRDAVLGDKNQEAKEVFEEYENRMVRTAGSLLEI